MIAVVILTYNAPADMLRSAVSSVLAGGGADHLIVVDNGSSAAESLALFPEGRVHLLNTGRNLGFAGGMNVGIEAAMAAGADHVALLNDDMVVDPGWLEILVGELGRDPSLGAVQPKLLFAGRDPVTVNSVGVTIGRDGAGTDIGYGEPDDGRFDAPIDLRCWTGGAVLLRVAMLRQIGLFDQRLFMYYEDVDLCLRGASAGWKFRCVPSARVWHIGSATADTMASTAVFHRERNRLWMLFRWAPWADVGRGLWLSVRRLRHPPRATHARALVAGLGGAPRQLCRRIRRSDRG